MILMYHNIGDVNMFNTVSMKQFITQMEYIIGSGRYDLLSLEEYINNLSKLNAINPITITFDDGYERFLSDVLPLAKISKIHKRIRRLVREQAGKLG